MENNSPKKWILNPLIMDIPSEPKKLKINLNKSAKIEDIVLEFNENSKTENYNIKKDIDDILISIQ
tara:strand:+ start:113 stop:310 length:198 start_codon:yes stop_codon:yes gene_type:complete